MQKQKGHRLKSVLLKAASTARSDRGVLYIRARTRESAEYNPVRPLHACKFLNDATGGKRDESSTKPTGLLGSNLASVRVFISSGSSSALPGECRVFLRR